MKKISLKINLLFIIYAFVDIKAEFIFKRHYDGGVLITWQDRG